VEINLPPELELFPHEELRAYQARFLRFVEKNPRAIIHAPVGFGKTIMALISTLPLVKTQRYQLFIFVRTKAQIFHVFLNQIRKIANTDRYGYLTALPLILKSDLCIRTDIPFFYRGICGRIRCPHLERARSTPEEDFPAIVEQVPITSHEGEIKIDTFKDILQEFGCPYYIIKRCIPYSNIVITTHTYLRSRNLQSMLSTLLQKSKFPNKICVIDEGHNFSAEIESELSLTDISKAKNIIPLKIFDKLEDLIKNRHGRVDRPQNLTTDAIDAFLDHQTTLSSWEQTNLNAIKQFLNSRGDIWISEPETLLQLNPFPDPTFRYVNNNYENIILMSGTFQPVSSYKALYGINYPGMHIPSDFQYSLNGILYHRRFTTKFRERTAYTFQAMASVIQRLHKSNPFHTIVFTPSHDLKQQILVHMTTPNIYEEQAGERPFFIDELHQKTHEIIFGVLGGKLSEGIEILHPQTKRSLLTLIIIAGVPYTRPNTTNRLIKTLYTKKWGRKMADHLTLLPVTRVMTQAIGRGIRSETDFAASLILDYRAATLRSMLPRSNVFRDLNLCYRTYNSFFNRMKRKFLSDSFP
jgi:Rad3-related DNA helicase